ncbi:hypothetical protein [Paenarthrobacter sp. YJN-5]|uniref:hypothetical protein n=1 Tax=Paenarthrobacter sp. YJN-5 TaxID=2735316 RepID=UPI001877F675|nr:hypothetical protein [Paenarthrobacter sp. YJN-5]QOT18577.1 hypothetical protein HMI59_19575 [Paenarthrobacter sp. YJN-5]
MEIHHRGQLVDFGTVECVTHDGSLLWLHQNGAVPRRIIEKSPDIYIRLTHITPDPGRTGVQDNGDLNTALACQDIPIVPTDPLP